MQYLINFLCAGAILITMMGCTTQESVQDNNLPSINQENSMSIEQKTLQEQTDLIANPNCFAPAADGRLLLADLANGISILDEESCEPVPCVDTTMRLPAAICEYQNEYYIADYRNNRIVVLNKEGHMVLEWTHEQLSDPEGITVDEDGNIYVASYGNGYILKFTAQGQLLQSWNAVTSDEDVLVHPHGLFYYEGLLYITELQAPARVIVYDLDGTFVTQFGNDQTTDYALEYPTSLYVYDDVVYVADAVANQIKLFSLDGEFLRAFGTFGMGAGQFYYPYGIGVDTDGNIYVGDTHNRRVQVFDSDWDLLKMYVEEALDIGSPAKQENISALDVGSVESLGLDADSIAVHNGVIYYTNWKQGIQGIYEEHQATEVISGYSYPWQINAVSNGIVIVDEPGAIILTPDGDAGSVYYPLTSLQFNAPEIASAFIYRFQDIAIGDDIMCLANTLPGNILLLDSYGSYIAGIDLPDTEGLGVPRVTGVAIDDDTLYYANMKGSVGCIDLNTQEHLALQSPIGLYQPYSIAVANNIAAVTEPYANRIQLWNCKTMEWIGYIDDTVVSLMDEPWDVTFDGTNLLVTSAGNDKVIIMDVKTVIEKSNESTGYSAVASFCTFGTLPPEVEEPDSLFMEFYHDRFSGAVNYWENYRDANGIVQYDFSFSFLSDNLPVPAGYGRHVWANGVAHYALLNHYINTEEALVQEKLHADWLVNNAIQNEYGIYYWPNQYDTTNANLQPDFMAASTQALGAAALIKAAEHFPDQADQYLQIAQSALSAFDLSIENGGVRTFLNEHVFFADYANTTGYVSYDVIPMAWTTAALYEAGEMGEKYYHEICETWNQELNCTKIFGDSKFCGNTFTMATPVHVWSSNLANTLLDFINQ